MEPAFVVLVLPLERKDLGVDQICLRVEREVSYCVRNMDRLVDLLWWAIDRLVTLHVVVEW